MNSDEVKKEREAFTDEEDTTYDLLLKQQQLYLQWQLENQNKVSQCQNQLWQKIYIDENKLCRYCIFDSQCQESFDSQLQPTTYLH